MANVRCKRGKEIDLLAINPIKGKKFHVESRVSTVFKLRLKNTRKKDGSTHRDSLDYFGKEKFEHPAVVNKIKELFGETDYEKVLVVYKTEEPVDSFIQKTFGKFGIRILLMKDVIADLREEAEVKGSRDDVMRFIELIASVERESHKAILSLFNEAAKSSGLYKTDLGKRLRKLMQIEKRTELMETLHLDKKTSTQRLRESMYENPT
jgi:hypothetical protein